MRNLIQKLPVNLCVLGFLIIFTAIIAIVPRNGFQVFFILVTFLTAGLMLKRHWLFASIAIMIVAIIFTLHDLAKVDVGESGKIIKKFQFNVSKDEKEK